MTGVRSTIIGDLRVQTLVETSIVSSVIAIESWIQNPHLDRGPQ
jgi:hypothetical protein